jgi:hypothetical protein
MADSDRPRTANDWWSRITVPGHTRWAFIAPALAALMFVGHAWEDAGWQGGGPYALVLAVSLLQLLRPTVLGWLLCTIPCLVYLVLFVAEAPLDPIGEWVSFLLVGLVPTLTLIWARPRLRGLAATPGSRTTGRVSDDAG